MNLRSSLILVSEFLRAYRYISMFTNIIGILLLDTVIISIVTGESGDGSAAASSTCTSALGGYETIILVDGPCPSELG